MRLLVTGGAGFMGSAFIRHCLADPTFDGSIVNWDALTYAGDLSNLSTVESDVRYSFVKADICDLSDLSEIDCVVHFAAESHVDRSIDSADAFVQTNVVGTYRLLETLRKFPKCHFHHISTDEVYGSIDEGEFTEHSPYRPNSPYAASKAASDHFVRAYAKTYGLSVTLSHASNNYGPGQYPEKLIPLMITKLIERMPLPIYGQGVNVRDWLYVDDHARAVRLIIEQGKRGEVYNVGGHQCLRNRDLIKILINVFERITGAQGSEELITYVTDRPGHDRRYAIDTTKIRHELGWRPEMDFEQGLERTVRWYLEKMNVSSSDNRLCHSR